MNEYQRIEAKMEEMQKRIISYAHFGCRISDCEFHEALPVAEAQSYKWVEEDLKVHPMSTTLPVK